jgi:hypothetical protein
MRIGFLEPRHRGTAVAFTPPAWTECGRPGAIVVPSSAPLVVIEGVGGGRRELADLVDAVIWVQADEATAALVDEWQREERPFLAAQRPWERPDHVVAALMADDPPKGPPARRRRLRRRTRLTHRSTSSKARDLTS